MLDDKETNEHPDHSRLFQFARLELEVTELFCELMENENVSRAELARRLGVSSAYVTKVLRGQSNLTLKTVSDFLFAPWKVGARRRSPPDCRFSPPASRGNHHPFTARPAACRGGVPSRPIRDSGHHRRASFSKNAVKLRGGVMAKKNTRKAPTHGPDAAVDRKDLYGYQSSASPVAAVVNLEAIIAQEFSASRNDKLLMPGKGMFVDLTVTDVHVERTADDKRMNISMLFVAKARKKNADESPAVEIKCKLLLAYRVASFEGLHDENLYAFAITSGVFSAWPYWREFVHSSCFRLAVEPIVLPTYRK